jgi:hypothetical protein
MVRNKEKKKVGVKEIDEIRRV